jgi:hypothetical protein
MKQDNELDELFRAASKPNLNEEIPSVFLSDLNTRLDALEQKRKKPLAFWWFFGVLALAIFAWGGTQIYHSSTKNQVLAANERLTESSAKTGKVTDNKQEKTENEAYIQTQSKSNSIGEYSKIGNSNSSKLNAKLDRIKTNVKNTTNSNRNFINKEETKVDLNLLAKNELQSEITSPLKIEIETETSLNESEKAPINSDSTTVKDSIKNELKPEKAEVVKAKKKISIQKEVGFFTGVSGIISSFEIPKEFENSITTVAINEYRERREREEIATSSWDFAFRMKWVINGFSVQTGLDYFQWGEQIRYDYNSISGINRYGYLNVPINLGYAKTFNKFGLNPFAGVMIGYGFNRTGSYLQPDLITVAETESKRYLANYQFGCEFYFLSESQFKFSLIPIYRASFKEVVYSESIRNRYKSIGLQLGISFNF